MKNLIFTPLLVLFGTCLADAQDAFNDSPKKQLSALKLTEKSVVLDGNPDEPVWLTAPKGDNFVQSEPNPGTPASLRTEVHVLYDNTAIYIGAKLFDPKPDSIIRQFSLRDDYSISDNFGVDIDSYQDGINGLHFHVTSAGVQTDWKFSSTGQDPAWDAVWQSAVKLHDWGWSVEIKIPFSALRFAKKDEQVWNVNFARRIGRLNETDFWNEVKPEVSGFFNQAGELNGIRDVKPPLRLFLFPYVSGNVNHYSGNGGQTSWGFNAGADIKYGISDAFTLDLTLVPDFGQVQSDNQVLNLSPFEVRFNERRPFFTEGTELFNKADLFYSRRIGGTPTKYWDIQAQYDTAVVSNPNVTQLINSTKLSGRTQKGLGIGVLNSITKGMHAVVRDAEGVEHKIETEPLTNYNIFVLDQNMKNNSYISFINTNVWRDGEAYEANVTGTEFQINSKGNKYFVSGKAALSQKYLKGFDEVELGYQYSISAGKNNGNFSYNVWHSLISDKYDHNDLGYLQINNIVDFGANLNYNIFKPFGIFNNLYINGSTGYTTIYKPLTFQNYWYNLNVNATFKNFWSVGFWHYGEPVITYDYYEPRVTGRYYTFPKDYNTGIWLASDSRKKVGFELDGNARLYLEPGRKRLNISFGPYWRASKKLTFQLAINAYNFYNDIGFADIDEHGNIIMGRRDQYTVENNFTVRYIFNSKMGINMRARHYWSKAIYNQFYKLLEDGSMWSTPYDGLDENGQSFKNIRYNFFNIDMVYRWQFAPGSEISVVWKNAIFFGDNNAEKGYFENLADTFREPQNNNISVKILYFVDYQSLRKHRS